MSNMLLVRCISKRETIPGQLVVGKKYWIYTPSTWKDSDGDEYAEIYLDEDREYKVGMMLTKHFEPIYRYLNYGGSLSSYVNDHIGFLLKDIIAWCIKQPSGNSLASNVIMYIHDNHLDTKENMEKEFAVRSTPVREFVKNGIAEEYMTYMGYSVYCIE